VASSTTSSRFGSQALTAIDSPAAIEREDDDDGDTYQFEQITIQMPSNRDPTGRFAIRIKRPTRITKTTNGWAVAPSDVDPVPSSIVCWRPGTYPPTIVHQPNDTYSVSEDAEFLWPSQVIKLHITRSHLPGMPANVTEALETCIGGINRPEFQLDGERQAWVLRHIERPRQSDLSTWEYQIRPERYTVPMSPRITATDGETTVDVDAEVLRNGDGWTIPADVDLTSVDPVSGRPEPEDLDVLIREMNAANLG
jgi:hypothetical protein